MNPRDALHHRKSAANEGERSRKSFDILALYKLDYYYYYYCDKLATELS